MKERKYTRKIYRGHRLSLYERGHEHFKFILRHITHVINIYHFDTFVLISRCNI